MRQQSGTRDSSSERLVKNIRRVTRKQYSSEEKIRIVLDGLRGEFSIAELCRREGIAESLYYSWSKEFLEAGKRRRAGDTARAATSSEVTELRREARQLAERWTSSLSCPRDFTDGTTATRTAGTRRRKTDHPGRSRSGTRIPDDVRGRVLRLALDAPELSPRELATRFIDTEGYFVSEASLYRLLKAHELITSPAFVVIKAADAFKDKTVRPNQLWQTDFTYLKVIGWGWFYLSTTVPCDPRDASPTRRRSPWSSNSPRRHRTVGAASTDTTSCPS